AEAIPRRSVGTKGPHGHVATPTPSNPTQARASKPSAVLSSMEQARPSVSLIGTARRFKRPTRNVERCAQHPVCRCGAYTRLHGLLRSCTLRPSIGLGRIEG